MHSGPFPVGPGLWGPLVLAALGLVLAVFGLVRQRGAPGLLALLLAALTAGAGVFAQVRAEREVDRFLTTMGPAPNRAAVERIRLYRYPHAQSLGRTVALGALFPLLLGALAALRTPLGSRALAFGFVGLAVVAWVAAWHISHRPLPVDRYAFPEDEDEVWALAIAIDGVGESATWGLHEGECALLDVTLRQAWSSRAVPPELQGPRDVAADRCVKRALAALERERDPKRVSELRQVLVDSALLQDEVVRKRLAQPLPRSEEEDLRRTVEARERLGELLGPAARSEALEAVLAHADAGVR